MSNYLRQREELIMAGFRAGMDTGVQRTADFFAIALNSPEVMGKDTLGYARIKKIYARAMELQREFAPAFQKGPEQDYYQELLDRRLRQIFPPDEYVPFAERYENITKPKYGK